MILLFHKPHQLIFKTIKYIETHPWIFNGLLMLLIENISSYNNA